VAQDWTPAEIDAARRYAKGEKLAPAAKRTLRRLERRLSREEAYCQRPDVQRQEEAMYANIDQALREEWARTGSSPGMASGVPASPPSSARPGAVSPSAPRPPGGGRGEPTTGVGALRRSAYDARTSSPADYKTRLQQLGIAAEWYEERGCNRPPPAPGIGIQVKQRKLKREAAERLQEREKSLQASRIDGRTATPEQVQARIGEILGPHRERPVLDGAFRPVGEPLKPPDLEPDPYVQRAEAERRALRRARQAAKSGKRADLRNAPSDVFAAYLRLRGLLPPTG
jgi:hypothetical protein